MATTRTVWVYEPPKHDPRRPRPRCSKCDAELVWALTERGAKMPLDAGLDFTLRNVRHTAGGKLYELDGGQTHWATCPFAEEYRRGRAAGG